MYLSAEDGTMHVSLHKRDKGQTWSSPIQGQGLLDPYSADLEQKRLMLQRFQEEVRYLFVSQPPHEVPQFSANVSSRSNCSRETKVPMVV